MAQGVGCVAGRHAEQADTGRVKNDEADGLAEALGSEKDVDGLNGEADNEEEGGCRRVRV